MTTGNANDEAFQRELTALIPKLRAFSRSICSNFAEAEDIAQGALAKAWAARSSFTIGTNMKAWAFMILRNEFYSEKRRSWRSSTLDPETAERTLVFESNPTATVELDEMRRALMMLSDEQREAVVLIGAGGMSYEEASTILGVNVGTVKSRVSRARNRLVSIFADGTFTPDQGLPSAAMASIFQQVDDCRRRCA